MNLKHLINKSTYGVIGYISSEEDLTRIEQYVLYNLEVLKEFKQIIIATNYLGDYKFQNTEIWKKYFPDCIILDSQTNRGHNFGTADLDNIIFDYCKGNDIEWLCKGANDVILTSQLFEIEVDEADFYYMNGFSFETIYKHKMDLDYLDQNHFTPQTNFYIINVSKTDYLNNKEYLSKTYDLMTSTPNYNNKPWEYIKGWSCEDFLAHCVNRNNLIKYNLLKGELYEKLFNLIKLNKIGDPSHKNIMIQGICHYQFPNQSIIMLNLEN
jgi:hypothetical protein|tara:strand:+ start:2903 stop:3706 length:804 start_codon:yes stop_codon:yes gene_type:complete